MIGRLLILATLAVLLSGCIMVPLALVGPATSGFTTASIMQSAITQSASYLVKQKTGKTVTEHAFTVIGNSQETIDKITNDELLRTYVPQEESTSLKFTPY